MRLKILYGIFVLLSAVLWMYSWHGVHSHQSDFADARKSGESILSNDRQKLERSLKKEILKDENWVKVNDYSLAVKDLVTKKNARELFNLTNESISDLARCLKKDFCGMERRNDDDAYFDESKTPAHILLGRNLEIMLESLQIYPELKQKVNWELINELTDSANEQIQVLSILLLKKFNLKEDESDKLYKFADDFKGSAKARALKELALRNSDTDRELLLNSIEKSFAIDDPHTAISIVESLGKMNLSKNELERVSRNLCHYKDNGETDPNWKMIRYLMGKISIDLNRTCTNSEV
ncbi:MAG: hypothetical protein ACXVLQ_15200 [Bacteriovorax sp.]